MQQPRPLHQLASAPPPHGPAPLCRLPPMSAMRHMRQPPWRPMRQALRPRPSRQLPQPRHRSGALQRPRMPQPSLRLPQGRPAPAAAAARVAVQGRSCRAIGSATPLLPLSWPPARMPSCTPASLQQLVPASLPLLPPVLPRSPAWLCTQHRHLMALAARLPLHPRLRWPLSQPRPRLPRPATTPLHDRLASTLGALLGSWRQQLWRQSSCTVHYTAWATADATLFPITLLKGIPNLLPVFAPGYCSRFLVFQLSSVPLCPSQAQTAVPAFERESVRHCIPAVGLSLRLSDALLFWSLP